MPDRDTDLDTDLDTDTGHEEAVEVRSCGYQGHEFGAHYPDSLCIDGELWDADSDDGDGMLTAGGDIPCPACRTREWLERAVREIVEDLSADYRQTEVWERVLAKAIDLNPAEALRFSHDLAGKTFSDFSADPELEEPQRTRVWPWDVEAFSAHRNMSLRAPGGEGPRTLEAS